MNTTNNTMIRRAACHEQNQDYEQSIYDYSRVHSLTPTNNQISLKLSSLRLLMGELEGAIHSIKECLHNDPDQVECKKMFRKIKSIQKGFFKLEEMKEKKKWKDVEIVLIEDGFLGDVEETGSEKLKEKVYASACISYHGVRKYFCIIF